VLRSCSCIDPMSFGWRCIVLEGDAGLGLCHHCHGVVRRVCPGPGDAILIGGVQRAFAL
jgi:hypothetical protein